MISPSSTHAVPEVYTVPPAQPLEEKPGQLSRADVQQYFDKGYVLVPKFFTRDEMQPAMEAVEECVDILANRYPVQRLIPSGHEKCPD